MMKLYLISYNSTDKNISNYLTNGLKVNPKNVHSNIFDYEVTQTRHILLGIFLDKIEGRNMTDINISNIYKGCPGSILEEWARYYGQVVDSVEFAELLDENDPLKNVREKFHYPKKMSFNACLSEDKNKDEACIYLCGNSLGLQPKSVIDNVNCQLKHWAELGVESHFLGPLPAASCDKYGRESLGRLLGAQPDCIVLMNGLTVNLHLLLISFYQPNSIRYKILIEKGAFPSDRYAVRSQIKMRQIDENALIEIAPRSGEHVLRNEDILQVIEEQGDEIAVICLSGVQYYTGQKFDMKTITEAGHSKGCFVGWDLAHAIGNVQINLDEWGADFACFCTYKYLNSGPGCIAGAYVNKVHKKRLQYHLQGWWGNSDKTRFAMYDKVHLAEGVDGFKLSNPSSLLVSCVLSSLEIFDEVGMPRLLEKQYLLTGYLEYLMQTLNSEFEPPLLQIATPSNPDERGCQLSIIFGLNLNEIHYELKKRGIICDIRLPNVMRIAPAPLYNSYKDVYEFVRILRSVLREMNFK